MKGIHLISGTSHLDLAKKIAKKLDWPLTPVLIKKFPNSEIYVRIGKKVRGEDVFVIQTMGDNVNDSLMELLIIIDALRRSSAGRINVVCPNLGYSRQDRKTQSHEPISAKLVANLITTAGANRLITVDLHASQIQGFYDIPLDHLVGYPLIAKYISKKKYKDLVVVAPDIGAAKKTHRMADLLGVPIAIVDKVRTGHGVSEAAHVVGDVKGKTALLLDDIVDGGGSIAGAAGAVKECGAKKIIVAATHAFLNGEAVSRLKESAADQVIFLDTVPIPKHKKFKGMTIISIAPLLAKIIKRVHTERSLGELFKWEQKGKLL
ncbi:MAG: ribose-phosphate pyrophosphokinase [Bacteriovorax sp.]|nr:ribose-phosphate pyrophosphokinase [Bacteriovorax sp.]